MVSLSYEEKTKSELIDEIKMLRQQIQFFEKKSSVKNDFQNHIFAVFDSLPMYIYIKDLKGNYRYFNKRCEDIFKVDPNVINHSDLTDFDFFPPKLAQQITEMDQIVIRQKTPSIQEEVHKIPDKTTPEGYRITHYYTLKTPVFSSDGNLSGISGFTHEITGTKIKEEALRSDKQCAEAANKAKTQFLSTMSHEIRTPLNSIIGFSQLLADYFDTHDCQPEVKDYLTYIKLSCNNLIHIVNEILEISRIESGKVELIEKPVKIKEFISNIYQSYKVQSQEKGITFHFKQNKLIPDTVVIDRCKLAQILLNLLGNSLKFTPTGGKISFEVKTNQDYSKIEFLISDSGIGMTQEFLDKAFTPFERADHQLEGTGLGLTITNRLLQLMGGELEINSKLNQGTDLKISIPLKMNDNNEQSISAPYKFEPISEEKMVLAIEDETINQKLLDSIFKKIGVLSEFAVDGISGIEKAIQLQPDLILMDMQLPNMNGIEVAQRIRNHEQLKDIPIIAISANAFTEQQMEALQAGFNGYLTKPIDFGKFNQIMHKYLS
jgi:signal transduction histidine kinase/CheY-like chemotaxis protein